MGWHLPQNTIRNGQNPRPNLGDDTKDKQPKATGVSRVRGSASRKGHDAIVLRKRRVGCGRTQGSKEGTQCIAEQAALNALGMLVVRRVETRGMFRCRDISLD